MEGWVDPEATGDDGIWRETCDMHDTLVADHQPVPEFGVGMSMWKTAINEPDRVGRIMFIMRTCYPI